MGQHDDKTTNKDGANQFSDSTPSQNTDDNSDVFTSAEYDFELLAKNLQQKPESAERKLTESNDESVSSSASASEAPWERGTSRATGNDETDPAPSADPEAVEPEHDAPSTSNDDLSNEYEKRSASPRDLPGKGSQSVVIDMGQLNEEAERALQEKAAQRAAFSPLESSGAMERITFSDLEAIQMPTQADEDESDMAYDSTMNSHRDELNAAFDDSVDFDEDAKPPRRPGRILFLLIVMIFGAATIGIGVSVINLGEHRDLLMRKPIDALKIGLGLLPPPTPPAPPKVPIKALQTVQGELKIRFVQIDWSPKGDIALVSGEVANESNVAHGHIELSVELFDEMTESLIVRRTKCCTQENFGGEQVSSTTDGGATTNKDRVQPLTLSPADRERFSSKLAVKKPKRGEVTAKVRVHYSEIIE